MLSSVPTYYYHCGTVLSLHHPSVVCQRTHSECGTVLAPESGRRHEPAHDVLIERRNAPGGDVGAVEFGDEAAAADDADAVPDVRLQIDIRRRRDERHDLPTLEGRRLLIIESRNDIGLLAKLGGS